MIVGKKDHLYLLQTPPVNSCRPSIDVLMRSVGEVYGRRAVGIILSGIGADGAQGLREIREKGGKTIVQDKETSVVFGIPRKAIEMGAAEMILPAGEIPRVLLDMVGGGI